MILLVWRCDMQHLMSGGPLLNEKGQLTEPGYAYTAVKQYQRSLVKAPKWRIKEWDYYYVGNSEVGFSVTISDLGYLSMIGITLFDFKIPTQYSKSALGFFPMGKLGLPNEPERGHIHVSGKEYDITIDTENFVHHIKGHYDGVCGKKNVQFDLTLVDHNHIGMCIATPFGKKGHFYYNYKINNLAATGTVTFGTETIDFKGTQGVLDWGRGVWTYKNTWYWLSFSGQSGPYMVGANLGYGFGNTDAASENMFFVREKNADVKAVKLTDVVFDIPKDAKGRDSFMDEWTIKSSEGLIDLKFKPVLNRHSKSDLLIIKSIQNQVFGYFDGTIIADGKPVKVKHVMGFAEKVYNAW